MEQLVVVNIKYKILTRYTPSSFMEATHVYHVGVTHTINTGKLVVIMRFYS